MIMELGLMILNNLGGLLQQICIVLFCECGAGRAGCIERRWVGTGKLRLLDRSGLGRLRGVFDSDGFGRRCIALGQDGHTKLELRFCLGGSIQLLVDRHVGSI